MSEHKKRWGIDKAYGDEALERMLPVAQEFRAKYDRLEAINADLLAALENVQWIDEGRSDTGPVLVCPACRHGPKQGHGLDCVIGNAVAKAKG